MFTRCEFCHRWILRWFYPRHEAAHLKLRADGQHTDYPSLPPEARYDGSLDGVPQVYRHPRCGVSTGMPEDIIRTYLVNPFTYTDGSFCCGCGEHVDTAQLFWVETGQSVLSYIGERRLDYLRAAFKLDLPDRPGGVLLTPPTVAHLKEAMLPHGGVKKVYLRLEKVWAGQDASYLADLDLDFSRQQQELVCVDGIRVALLKEQRDEFAGVVVHYDAGRTGFFIGRLYAPDE